MTTRILNALATELRASKPKLDQIDLETYQERLAQWRRDVEAVTEVARHFNSGFDLDKWNVAIDW